MKKLAICVILGMIGLALLYSSRVSQTRFISVPAADNAQASRIAQSARSINWAQEIADAGFMGESSLASSLVQAIADADVRTQGTRLELVVEFDYMQISTRESAQLVDATFDFVERRLTVEASIDSIAGQPTDERQHRLWQLFGSGFDRLARTALTDHARNDPDADVRAHAARLLAALGEP